MQRLILVSIYLAKQFLFGIGEFKFGDVNEQCHRYACIKFKMATFNSKNLPNRQIKNLAKVSPQY